MSVDSSVFEVFKSTATQWPDRPFMEVLPRTADVYGIEAEEITYDDAMDEVEHWIEHLGDAGYGAGMRIALLLENRPVYFLILLAANRLGISVVPINPDLRSAELEYLIGHAEPALVIAIKSRVADLQTAIDATDVKAKAITIQDDLPRPRRDAVIATLTQDDTQRLSLIHI